MYLVALINLTMGGYVLYDAFLRITTNQSLLIFDAYMGGFAKALPILLGISMILASVLILVKKSTAMLFYSYINSFLFLLFYTPSVFYNGIEERYSPWFLVIQFLLMLTCTILLYATKERGTDRARLRTKITYEEYKKSMQQFLNKDQTKKSDSDKKPDELK